MVINKSNFTLLAYLAVLINLIQESLLTGVIDSDVALPISNTIANED